MATVGRIIVLLWADILALYAMYIMMAYLTDVWKLSFTRAAAIVNVFWGVVGILPLLLQFIVDTVMGNYWMLLISSFAYSAGLGFLTMSTPPVLAKAMGTCTFGVCGHITSWGPFMAEQLNEGGEIDEGTFWRFFYSILAVIIITIVAVIALPYIKPWSIRFGIPAICTLVATLLFFTGSCSYNYFLPQGSPLTTFVRVFVASTSKFLYASPKDVNKLYENPTFELDLVPHTRSLRCLDKAAIIVPSKTLEEQQKNRWRLCTVTEVEETKTIIRMIPVWLTFIFCGVVSSIGFTYFIEQLDHLNPKVGRLKVPPIVLLWFYDQAKT
ncbi:Protein NRT1/PTR FAMILY 5.5 [Forsythia ovata]|uniref:Protein NRT1/PTR FAMILY 5.5 n=1 Tax=Forsythia ovata TaxID=205694 RepID=A0ABD1SIK3_9LAMI